MINLHKFQSFLFAIQNPCSHFNLSPKYVRLGDLDIHSDKDDAGALQFNIAEVFVHPSYTFRSRYDDIGLIKIAEPIKFTEYIRPACLHYFDTKISDRLTEIGWGITEYGGNFHSQLQKVHLDFVSPAKCYDSYANRTNSRTLARGIDNATHLCAGTKPGAKDSCQVNSQKWKSLMKYIKLRFSEGFFRWTADGHQSQIFMLV